MSHRFNYVKYDELSIEIQEKFKKQFEAIEAIANDQLHDGRAKSLLMTALEEAYMWTGKAIRDQQMIRGFQTAHVPERG